MAAGMTVNPPRAEKPNRRSANETSFTRQLRYEWADAEGRIVLGSYMVSVALGIVWLLLVHFVQVENSIKLLRPEETGPVEVTFEDIKTAPEPTAAPTPAPAPAARPAGNRNNAPKNDTKRVADAFGGSTPTNNSGGLVGDVSNVLRGVDVNSASAATPSTQGKAVIGYGQGGAGSRTPGRGDFGAGLGSGSGLGGVGNGPGVGYGAVRIEAPKVIRAENIGGPGRNVDELGSYVRGRSQQLQFCYQEYGLKVNPGLAGTVTVAVTMSGTGDVSNVGIAQRTWGGPGASEAESCIKQRISGWKFPNSDRGGGTFNFPFSFTK
jgi:hypothetical protein